jgi:hypothetical protein
MHSCRCCSDPTAPPPAPPLPRLTRSPGLLTPAALQWKALQKKALNRRESLASLQQAEAVEIRRKSDAFAERVEEYRK